jgi:hypothetical protein
MATFGKRGAGPTAPQWLRQEPAHSRVQPDMPPDRRGASAPQPTAEEEARFRFWQKVARICRGFYLLVVLGFGFAMFTAPFYWLAKWQTSPSLQLFGYMLMGLCLISMLLSFIAMAIVGMHRARYPVGIQAYMHRNPKVYVVGTVVGLASFLLLSEHSAHDLVEHFSVNDILSLDTSDREAPRPWADFILYIAVGWLGIGALFYALDKLHGEES